MFSSFQRLTIIAVACCIALSAPPVAYAQDKRPPATEFNGDIGFVSVTGNTSVTTLNIGERWIRRFSTWDFKQDFGVVYGRTDSVESSNLLRSSLRADYRLGPKWALYALTAFDRNRFAGIRSRFSEGAGLVAKLLASDVNQLDLESGVQVTQQSNIDRTYENFKSVRAATTYRRVFAPNAYFLQSAEFLPNIDESKDLRINSETAVVAPLSSNIGLKLSYVVRFDNLPSLNAEGTARLGKTDRIFSSGIQVTF